MLATLAVLAVVVLVGLAKLFSIDKVLGEAPDLGQVEYRLGRGNVLRQRVDLVLEAVPLEGFLVLAVEADQQPVKRRRLAHPCWDAWRSGRGARPGKTERGRS